MTVNDLYNALNNLLAYLDKDGFHLNENTVMKVVRLTKDDPNIDIYFQRIDDRSEKVIKLYFHYGFKGEGHIFSVIRFENDGLVIRTDTNLAFDIHDVTITNNYINQLNSKIPVGVFRIIDDIAYYMVKFDYADLADLSNQTLMKHVCLPMLSAYSIIRSDILDN